MAMKMLVDEYRTSMFETDGRTSATNFWMSFVRKYRLNWWTETISEANSPVIVAAWRTSELLARPYRDRQAAEKARIVTTPCQ